MPKLIFKDASVVVNGVDLSDHVESVTINYSAEMQDNTAMGQNTRTKEGGLKDWSVEITFQQDYAAAKVDATMFPLVGVSTTIVIMPTSGAVSATNPSFTGTGVCESYVPVGGAVGDLGMTPVTFVPASGDLVRAVA